MALQSKMIVYAAIAGLLALMGGFVYYASLDNPELEKVEVRLSRIEVQNVNTVENRAELKVTFLVKNPSDKTFTIPLIAYELYGDGMLLGSGQYSTEDIPMPGRAAFYPGSEIPLESIFVLSLNEIDSDTFQKIVDGQISGFHVKGMITSESAWSLIEKEFETSI